MERTFSTPEPITLHVEIGRGEVRVDAQDGLDETRVIVDGRDADDVVVEQRGDRVMVVAPQHRGGLFIGRSSDVYVNASVPTHSGLSAKLGSADLVATGRYGTARLRSGSGDVRVDALGEDATVETGSGAIDLVSTDGDLRVKSGSGDVTVRKVSRGAQISTGSGDVVLGSTEREAVVKSGSGDLRVDDASSDLAMSSASGQLDVGVIRRGAVQAKAVSGDVNVGVPAGIPVWADVSCVSGRVSSSLEGAGQPDEGQEFIEIRATSVTGDIRLEER